MQWVQPISGQAKRLKQQDAKAVQLAAAAPRVVFMRSTNERKRLAVYCQPFLYVPALGLLIRSIVSLFGVGEMWNEHNSQKLLDRPNVISELSSHSRCAWLPSQVF